MYLLDTTAISALMRSETSHVGRLLALHPADVRLPHPAVAEVRYGLARLPRSRRRRSLEARLELLLESIERTPWDDAVSSRFGTVKALLESRRHRLEDFDLMMAAHALELDATLVTSNVRHFARVPGLSIEDWGSK